MRSDPLASFSLLLVACVLGAAVAAAAPSGEVYDSPEAVQPLGPGDRVPAVRVESVRGEDVDLADLVSERGALLVFYRGGWCPYCNTQLSELRKVQAELAELGFPVVAVSPDRPVKLAQSLEAEDLGYTLCSDSDLAAARAFGIAFQLDDALVEKYRGYGIDLEEASGRGHHQLPVPSVFLVEPGGTIRWAYSNPDYKVRPENAALLEAARRFRSRSGAAAAE